MADKFGFDSNPGSGSGSKVSIDFELKDGTTQKAGQLKGTATPIPEEERIAHVEQRQEGGVYVRSYKIKDESGTLFKVKTQAEEEADIKAYEAKMMEQANADFQKRQDAMKQQIMDEMEDKARAEALVKGLGGMPEPEYDEDDPESLAGTGVKGTMDTNTISIEPDQIEQKLSEIVKDDRIVCIGDSITYGHQVEGKLTWIGRLRREQEINLLNVGVDGDTTGNMLTRFKEHVLDLKPKAVLIMGGGNDIFGETPIEYVTNNIAMMCQMALDHGIVPMVGIEPEPDHKKVPKEWKQFIDYDKCCETLMTLKEWLIMFGKANNLPIFDFDTEMKNRLRAGYSRYFFDGAHPNPAGHKIMAEIAKEELQSIGILPPDPDPAQDEKFSL